MDHECLCKKEAGIDDFTAEQWKSIDEVIAKHRDKPGALIPVLEEIQGITGYLPESVQRRVASGLSLPLSQVYGVSFLPAEIRKESKKRGLNGKNLLL
jgi:NADH:ubiquinone oxidoreductase subunit E